MLNLNEIRKQKNKYWNGIWEYFRGDTMEDMLLAKSFRLRYDKTQEEKIESLVDIILYGEKYLKLLQEVKK